MTPAEGMAACPDPVGRRPRLVERTIVHGAHDLQQAGRVALVDRFGLVRRELDAVERLGHHVVHQETLHDSDDLAYVVGREVTVFEGGEASR